jgi:hypothetical protein
MAIARFPSIVIDCPDPDALAAFYATMLDWKSEPSDGWVDIRADYGQCISFQPVENYTPPAWPAQDVPPADAPRRGRRRPRRGRAGGHRARRDQARIPAGHDLPGIPGPGRASVLPLHELTQAGRYELTRAGRHELAGTGRSGPAGTKVDRANEFKIAITGPAELGVALTDI